MPDRKISVAGVWVAYGDFKPFQAVLDGLKQLETRGAATADSLQTRYMISVDICTLQEF